MLQIRERMLVLRRRRLREADAALSLLGEHHGKLTAKAPSLSKTSNRLAGTLQPYNLVDVVLYARRKDQDMWTVTQAGLVRHHATLQEDVVRLAYAGCAVELVDALTPEPEPVPSLFRLTAAALEYWDRCPATRIELVAFHLRVLELAGLAPSFECCLRCGATEADRWRFSASAGGLVCTACAGPAARTLSVPALHTLRHLAGGGKASTCRAGEDAVKRMMALLHEHLEYHGAWRSKAWRFLEEVAG